MPRDLSRLLRPKSIAVVGGGVWCQQVVRQSQKMGFSGDIFRVHPNPDQVEGIAAVPALTDLPYAPDAVFLGINRHATVETVRTLRQMGAGGAVCFASGFAEAQAEAGDSAALQTELIRAARDMPILGPNCYGFINALEGALLWPDQHGCTPVETGVAILAQSSNIAINLSMQLRGLPIACVVTCGNMAQTSQAEIAMGLLDDPRITAIGLHVEGFGDAQAWHDLAKKACDKGVPLVVLKVGASDHARAAAFSHTASVAGSDAGAAAFVQRLGAARVDDLPGFLSALMIAHCNGELGSNNLSSISCSGGEASLVADMAEGVNVTFPPLTIAQTTELTIALGQMVSLSNPLDYHTYIWGDLEKMTAAWRAMAAEHIGLVLIVLDYPHTDRSAWETATKAAIAVRRDTGRPIAVVSTLPELLPLDVSRELLAAGVTPLHGLREAMVAAAAMSQRKKPASEPPLQSRLATSPSVQSEAAAKTLLKGFGVAVPKGTVVRKDGDVVAATADLRPPFVVKMQGVAHKSESGGVHLGVDRTTLTAVVQKLPGEDVLIEEMVSDCVVELLIGVVRDPAHGFVLTVACGGTLTELWRDRASLLLPITRADASSALQQLWIYPVLCGYRGAQPADTDSILATIMAVQDCVLAHADKICEIEINPLICTPETAVAADALVVSEAATKTKEH